MTTQTIGTGFKYSVQAANNVDEDLFLRIVRTRFQDDQDGLAEFMEPYSETPAFSRLTAEWETLVPLSPADSAEHASVILKRTIFWAIRPERYFPQTNPVQIATHTDDVIRRVLSADGEITEVPWRRTYNLYEISSQALGVDSSVLALQCWCPSTGKEHWIMLANYVLPYVLRPSSAYGGQAGGDVLTPDKQREAIAAALTETLGLRSINVKEFDVYRHGDIVVVVPRSQPANDRQDILDAIVEQS
jgi:hypothetical protein